MGRDRIARVHSQTVVLRAYNYPIRGPRYHFLRSTIRTGGGLPTTRARLRACQRRTRRHTRRLSTRCRTTGGGTANLGYHGSLRTRHFLITSLQGTSRQFTGLATRGRHLTRIGRHVGTVSRRLRAVPTGVRDLRTSHFIIRSRLGGLQRGTTRLTDVRTRLSSIGGCVRLRGLLPTTRTGGDTTRAHLARLLACTRGAQATVSNVGTRVLALTGTRTSISRLGRRCTRTSTTLAISGVHVRRLSRRTKRDHERVRRVRATRTGLRILHHRTARRNRLTTNCRRLGQTFSRSNVPRGVIHDVIPLFRTATADVVDRVSNNRVDVRVHVRGALGDGDGGRIATLSVVMGSTTAKTLPCVDHSNNRHIGTTLSIVLTLTRLGDDATKIRLKFLFVSRPPFLSSGNMRTCYSTLRTVRGQCSSLGVVTVARSPRVGTHFPRTISIMGATRNDGIVCS